MSLNDLDPGADITQDGGRFQLNTTLDKIAKAVRTLQAVEPKIQVFTGGQAMPVGARGARCWLNTTTATTTATPYDIEFDEFVYDHGGWVQDLPSDRPLRLPADMAGRIVLCQAQVSWEAPAGNALLRVQLMADRVDDSGEEIIAEVYQSVIATHAVTINLGGAHQVTAGDKYFVRVTQSTGGDLDVLGPTGETWLTVTIAGAE